MISQNIMWEHKFHININKNLESFKENITCTVGVSQNLAYKAMPCFISGTVTKIMPKYNVNANYKYLCFLSINIYTYLTLPQP